MSFYRLGSSVRVPLKAPAQAVALATFGASVKTALAWGFVNNQTITTVVAGLAGTDIATIALAYASGMTTTTTALAHGLTVG